MTPQQIVALAIRFFAIWFGFNGLTGLAYRLPSWIDHGYPAWEPLVAAVVLFVISALIWRFPLTIANKIVPREPIKINVPMTAESLARAAVAVLGVGYLASGVVSVLWLFIATAELPHDAPSMSLLSSGFFQAFGSKLISIFVGAILLANSHRIAAACTGVRRTHDLQNDNQTT